MSISATRRPAAALAVAALLSAGLAAPAGASPWSDAWAGVARWFAGTPLGALWAEQGTMVDPNGVPLQAPNDEGMMVDPSGAPRQVVGNEGIMIDPNGRPAQSNAGIGVNPNGAPQP